MSSILFDTMRRLLQKSRCQKCGKQLSAAEKKQGKLCSGCTQGKKNDKQGQHKKYAQNQKSS